MADPTLPCLVCGKKLSSAVPEPAHNQPANGTAFVTWGHYGSTVFDPMDGTRLQVNVCDLCLTEHRERVHHVDRHGVSTLWNPDQEDDCG